MHIKIDFQFKYIFHSVTGSLTFVIASHLLFFHFISAYLHFLKKVEDNEHNLLFSEPPSWQKTDILLNSSVVVIPESTLDSVTDITFGGLPLAILWLIVQCLSLVQYNLAFVHVSDIWWLSVVIINRYSG